jgi:cell division protein FtsI/penicillin-binding protein 2
MNYFGNTSLVISNFRINALLGVIFLLVLGIIGRLFYLQILQHDYYLQAGLRQRSVSQEILPERGRIYALASEETSDELYPLAINQVYYEVSINPSIITHQHSFISIFVDVLEMEEDYVLPKVKQDNVVYELIVKEVSQEKYEELQEHFEALRFNINKDLSEDDQKINLSQIGINFVKNVLRYYPDKEIGSHIIGFLGYSNDGHSRVGKYGLEGYWQEELAGIGGQLSGETDVAGRLLSDDNGSSVQNGDDIILTIDRNVQYTACKSLEKAVAQYDAASGSVIIMETKTGAIKAMCNYPSFDPNEYNLVESGDVYYNNNTYWSYEPGSVMKAISMAIAIDQGKVTPDTTYNDEGKIKFAGGEVIRNSDLKAHGVVDMKEILASSLNTGIIFATSDVNGKIFEDYIKKFGFGKQSGIALSQDSAGNIKSLESGSYIYKATASYGQGITVTPLQMVNSINAIANRGNLMQPYIVREIRHEDGQITSFEPTTLRKVITDSTVAQISAMMVHVVDSGHADKAGVEGYYVAGKTGTAQVANQNTGKYDADKTIHNFVGFAPHDDPKFTMITKLDYPTAANFSADTAAPLFGEIASFLLEYYQIPPNR